MVQVSLELALITIGFILVLGLMIESRMRLNETVIEVQDQLDLMERGLEVVAGVLQQLPSLVPQFSINQSPLGQILEFFQGMNAPKEGSYDAPALRDSTGQYSDGETDQSTEGSVTETPE